jgi:hypothetical protein
MLGLLMIALVLVAGVTLVHAPASEASVNLFTAPLWINQFEGVDCLIANVSATTFSVRIHFMDAAGTVIGDSGSITLQSGDSVFHTHYIGQVPRLVRCKIIAGGSSKANFRATMQRFTGGSDLNGVSAD